MAAPIRPAIPAPPHRGGCLCGSVRYRLDGPPLSVSACHCGDCKRLTGATHNIMVLAERTGFTQEQGETHVYRKVADSGRVVELVRCAQCGTRLWHNPQLGPQYVMLVAGTLDAPDWVVPTAHIWTARAAPNTSLPEECLLVEGQPQDRQGMIDAFARIYG